MNMTTTNMEVYRRPDIAAHYPQTGLQNGEVSVCVKYKEHIWQKNMLDIGCGAGRTTMLFRNFTAFYTGLDSSPQMVAFCQNRFPGMSFVEGDVRNLGRFGSEQFEFLLFSYNGLDQMGHQDRLTALAEIHRVLKVNHLFVFSSHNRSFRHAQKLPGLDRARNPFIQLRFLSDYWLGWRNHYRNRRFQEFHPEYAVINDLAHNYSLLTYYIGKCEQVEQLRPFGFEVLDMFDTAGTPLNLKSEDEDVPWIYYVCRKVA